MAVWISLVDFIVHEIVYQYQNHSLPEAFLEYAVRYYQRQISQKLGIGYIIEDITEERISFYKQLISRYEDDVHRLFFNGNIDERKKFAILQKFNHEAEKLFPENEGLINKKDQFNKSRRT